MFAGILFVVIGLVVILAHEDLIKSWDYWNNGLFGEAWWTGKFTRGGRTFLYGFGALLILFGLLLVGKSIFN